MDIAQMPNLPEKTSESSETSDSESESKENSGEEEGEGRRRKEEIKICKNENNHAKYGGEIQRKRKERYAVILF